MNYHDAMNYNNAKHLFFSFFILSFAVAGQAQEIPAEDPAPALQATLEDVIDMTAGQTLEEIESMLPELRERMSETFSIEALVQRAFGRNWQRFDEEEKTKVIDLLGRLIIRTYADQLSAREKPTIEIDNSRPIGPNRWEVFSTITHEGDRVNVIYRLAPIDGEWKVYDVIAENVNLVGNYRQQFDAHFQRNKSVNELFVMLREKLREAAGEQ